MKQFFTLLSLMIIIGSTGQLNAQAAASGDIEYLINGSTTRAELVQITQELAAKGVTLNVKTATFNSANQVMTISLEVYWKTGATEKGVYESENVRETGDIWIIKTETTNCLGDCK